MKVLVALCAVLAIAAANPLPLVQIIVNVDAPASAGVDNAVDYEIPHAELPVIDFPVEEEVEEEVIIKDPVFPNPGNPAILPKPVLPTPVPENPIIEVPEIETPGDPVSIPEALN